MGPRLRIALRTALWLLLGGWVGAIALLSAGVAPAAFRVLPASELAGDLVGAVLGPLELYGAAAGLALAGLALALGRGRAAVVLALLLCLASLVSHFGVSPRLAELRELGLGPGADPIIRARFGRLHGLSALLLLGVGAGAVVLAVLHARAEEGAPADSQPVRKTSEIL
jgi:hypothetical protein